MKRWMKAVMSLLLAGGILSGTGSPAQASPAASFPPNFKMTDERNGWGADAGGLWRTTDGGRTWNHPAANVVPASGAAEDIPFAFWGLKNGMIISAYGPQQPVLLFRTAAQGASWKVSRIPVQEARERGYGQGFISFAGNRTGYLLLHSGPALGLMEKWLYRTTDGGASWTRMGVLTDSIESYPTGMTFRDALNGWITSSNHGQESILTYRTADGGKHWHQEKLPVPPSLTGRAYSNSYPPVFSGAGAKQGLLPLEIVNNGVRSMVFYTTGDGGDSWKYGPVLQGTTALRTGWLNAREGWALQEGGKLLVTRNGGVSWTAVAKAMVFDKAERIQFVSAQTGWISGPQLLWQTGDGGRTWTNLLKSR